MFIWKDRINLLLPWMYTLLLKIKFITSLFKILLWAWAGRATPTWNDNSVSIVNFEKVNADWVVLLYWKKQKYIRIYCMAYNSQLENTCGLWVYVIGELHSCIRSLRLDTFEKLFQGTYPIKTKLFKGGILMKKSFEINIMQLTSNTLQQIACLLRIFVNLIVTFPHLCK